MEPSKYDVIIPVYNAEETLAETLKSVLGQSQKPARVIVIDDLSSDSSARIAQQFGVEVHRNEFKRYSAGSRNHGLFLSTSPWVATIDADDLWQENTIEELFKAIGSHSEIDVVGGLLKPFGDGLTEPYENRNLANLKQEKLQKLRFNDFLLGSPLAASACIFRKKSLDEAGGWPMPTFAEDYHLLVEMFVKGFNIYRLNLVVGSYRLSSGQKSSFIDLQTESQLVALGFLFTNPENRWGHEKAIFRVWLSYLARIQNAGKSFSRKSVPRQFSTSRLSCIIDLMALAFSNKALWALAGLTFKGAKKMRMLKSSPSLKHINQSSKQDN